MTLIPFDDSTFYWGAAGLPGANAPAGQMADFEDRITYLEALTPPTVLSDLSDADTTGVADGDLFRYNGGTSKWEPYTWPGTTYTFSMPFVLDGGGSAIAAGTWYNSGILVPFACTWTGWVVDATSASNLVVTVQRAPTATPSTFSAISGTEKPTLTGVATNSDLTLTTVTSAIAAFDRIRLSVDATPPTSIYATVNLIFTRTI